MVDVFSKYVADQMKVYVYRLIDPRNGETFYVGKGTGNRVFAHVKGEASSDEDALTAKLQRIRDIKLSGFDVSHVIHRHGLDDAQAFEVEAALIDAYPGVTNLVGGKGSDERGLMHARQIVERYEAPEAKFAHSAVVISINRTVEQKDSPYEAVRYAWKVDPKKARKAELVIAVQQGLIVGVYVADRWMAATPENFPGTSSVREGRWGFVGREALPEIVKGYIRHKLPPSMRKQGAANPVRYVGFD